MNDGITWTLKTPPRTWQATALERWQIQKRGVASVVTGGGKTIFAFLCMEKFLQEFSNARFLILVPTITLVDQWYVSLQEDFGVPETDIACFSSQEKPARPSRVNILVL